jgi:hypothetical protein
LSQTVFLEPVKAEAAMATSAPENVPPMPADRSTWQVEYEQVSENFRALAECRFRLLALVPTLGGAAIFLLSKMTPNDGTPGGVDPFHLSSDYPTVVFVAILGFLATLGITFYDQRNSELYGFLFTRGQELENMLYPPLKNFLGRKKRGRFLLGLFPMKHDTGLALIYAPVLGAWFYPMLNALLRWRGCTPTDSALVAFWVAGLVGLVFFEEFLRLDGFWKKLFKSKE